MVDFSSEARVTAVNEALFSTSLDGCSLKLILGMVKPVHRRGGDIYGSMP